MRTKLELLLGLLKDEAGKRTLYIETDNDDITYEIQKLEDCFEITKSKRDNINDRLVYENFYKNSIDEVIDYLISENRTLKIVLS